MIIKKIAVIGGGAAGLMAAGRASEYGADVTVFEKMDKTALKLGITGKGRCNITNNCTPQEVIANTVTNPKFVMSALHRFPPEAVMKFFEEHGIPLKTERGKRVFPVSDKAYDIVRTMRNYCSKCTIINERVARLTINDGMVCGLETQTSAYTGFDAVILATGGMSYPQTGSSGDGYNFAREAGHTIIEPKPSLVPLEIKQKWCGNLTGLSLRNVGLDIVCGGENVYHDFGELLFTHFGISGPIVLSASAHMKENTEYKIFINLKPALTAEELDKRIVSDFEKYKNCDFINSLGDLLPIKLIPVIAEISGIGERKKVNSITKAERKKLGELIQGLPLDFMKFRPIEEAIITRGGVCVSEIDPKTMASKKVGGLYFAGEVIDVDAYTGGFNLQIVFSTARAAAEAAIAEAATAEAAADVSGNVPDNKTK